MTIDTAGFFANLNPLWPEDDDLINEGAAQIRVVKESLQLQFPGLNAEVSATPSEMNALTGADEANPLQAQIDALVAAGNRITGEVRMYGGTAAPPDGRWLICAGTTLDRGVYADLFAAIGVTYGAPSGSTFSIPDYRGRSPIGPGTDGAVTSIGQGVKYGASTVTLTAAQSGLPSHSHTLTAPNGAGNFVQDLIDTTNPVTNYFLASSNGGVTNAAGGQAAAASHENQSPAQGINFIIAMSEADYNRANP